MIFQQKIIKNAGKDTFVRGYQGNAFQQQSSKTFQMIPGEIEITEPEPLFRQNMVTVRLAQGGRITSVAYPGAFIDPRTGNLHGTYEGPIPGQMVMVGFGDGNLHDPFVVNRYPYQGAGNTLYENKYITPLTKASFDATDVMIGHFSGSYLSFNTGILSGQLPGSVTLNATNDFNLNSNTAILLESLVTAEVKSAITTLTGSTYVALNGTTNYAVKYTELKSAFDTLRTEVNNLITKYNLHSHPFVGVAPGSPGTTAVTTSSGTPAIADMSASQNTKVLM